MEITRPQKRFTIKDVKSLALKFMRNKISMEELEALGLPDEVFDAVKLTIEAYQYMIDFEKSGNRYITERLRTAYVGEETNNGVGGKSIVLNRGRPTGTIIGVLDGDTLKIGTSKISENEKFACPIVGLYLALKNAKEYGENELPMGLNAHERRQAKRFILRAKAYFFPDKYSYSRGSDPVVYPNYDEIHKRQIMILGEERVAAMACKGPSKNAKNKGRRIVLD